MTADRDRATRDRLADRLVAGVGSQMPPGWAWNLDKALDALLPVVAELVREGQADALAPFEELFAGGPDTSCQTTWRSGPIPECSAASIECVEVPMADLRDAFDRAGRNYRAPRTDGVP